jgi:hypothetical protein
LGAFFCPQGRAKKPGFPLQVLGSADALPVGFPLQSHCASAAQNYATQLPAAIAWAANCLWQLAAYNPAVAIVEQLRDVPPSFFVVCRKKTRLYHHRLPTPRGFAGY